MPLFVCDICQAIDNTACGHFWGARTEPPRDWFGKPELLGKCLCSECMPTTFHDGSENDRGGKWHGRFPKMIATTEDIDRRGREHFEYTAGL